MTAGGLSFLLNICVAGFLRRVGMSVIMWGFFLGKACRRLLSFIVVACERVVLLFPPPHGGQKTANSAASLAQQRGKTLTLAVPN